jgi:hypothetical protein
MMPSLNSSLRTHARSQKPALATHLFRPPLLGAAISTESGQVPKSFPKIFSTPAVSLRLFGLSIICKRIVVGAPGLEPGTR